MKLHSLHIVFFMLQSHNVSTLVFCCYLEVVGKIFFRNDPAMVPANLYLGRESIEEFAGSINNFARCRNAMINFAKIHEHSAKCLANGLVAKTNAENRF